MQSIQFQLKTLPNKPGVYILKNKAGEVLYIGKAKKLKARVRSYFAKTAQLAPDKRRLVELVATIEHTIVDSETEALMLEANLIKEYQPRFNILLRDDKYYLFIKLTLADEFPTLELVRRPGPGPARYFGPYTQARFVRELVKLLQKIFLYRTCKLNLQKAGVPYDQKLYQAEGKPCFLRHLKRCLGPCVGAISPAEYAEQVTKPLQAFLAGKTAEVAKELRETMQLASRQKAYERAAVLRDQLRGVEAIINRQRIVTPRPVQLDVLGLARSLKTAHITLHIIRAGRQIRQENFELKVSRTDTDGAVIQSFLQQYYRDSSDIPTEILLPVTIPTSARRVLEKYLSKRRQVLLGGKARKILLTTPVRGRKKALVKLAQANAQEQIDKISRAAGKDVEAFAALQELARALKLDRAPSRVEIYDISNIQGRNAVGAMVVFKDGLPAKQFYRKFKIQGPAAPNDVAMLQEVLQRRLQRTYAGKQEHTGWPQPDLIIIDGGKPQLNAAVKILAENKLTIPVIALAKRIEEIFMPHRPAPLILPHKSRALFLIQRMRDEAHRFALEYHRRLRTRQQRHSVLDDIPGVGPATKQKILRHYGSLAAVRRATAPDLEKVIGRKLATTIKEKL